MGGMKKMKTVKKNAGTGTITCPQCGHSQSMQIPVGMCQAFYRCDGCKNLMKAEKSCCVFCDYGDRKCPVGAHPLKFKK